MVLFSVYCLVVTLVSTEQAEARLARFLACVIIIGFIIYPVRKKGHKVNHIPWYDIVLMIAGAGSFLYFTQNVTNILLMGARIEPLHVALGVVGTLVLVELCRRCVGLPIIIVVCCLIAYAFYWQLSSSSSGDLYSSLRKIVQKLFYTTSGVIGTPINVCCTYIVLFVIFGAFLERTGIANFFIAFANRIAGWSSGGAAKVSVIASALCGMVSGSSVGNTVTTGSVTIPMMKKVGYKPEFAGAVEAASSSGGQIMPPIMGAAAFLMAEYMGIPYLEVATKAIVPALLYFAGIFIAVHLEAKKLDLKGIPREELPTGKYLLKNCYLIIPLVLLVWLVSSGTRTMASAAAISIGCAFLIGFIHFLLNNWHDRAEGETFGEVLLETVKIALLTAVDAFAAGAKNCIAVAVACAMAGMIAGCITVTGLASTIINVIVLMAGDMVIVGLVFDHDLLPHPGHGRAHHGKLLHHGLHVRAHSTSARHRSHLRALLRVLLRHRCRHPRLPSPWRPRGERHREIASDGHGGQRHQARHPKFVVPYIFAFSPVLLLVGDDVTAVAVVSNTLRLWSACSACNARLPTRCSIIILTPCSASSWRQVVWA